MWIYYYSGMVKPITLEMTPLGKIACYPQLPRGKGILATQGHRRQQPGGGRGAWTLHRK